MATLNSFSVAANNRMEVYPLHTMLAFYTWHDAMHWAPRIRAARPDVVVAVMMSDGASENAAYADVSDGWSSRHGPTYRIVSPDDAGEWREVRWQGKLGKRGEYVLYTPNVRDHHLIGEIVPEGETTPHRVVVSAALGSEQSTAE